MNALEQLINEAEAEIRKSEERRADLDRQEQERKSEKEAELKRFLADKLGPAYDELLPFCGVEECDGYWLCQIFYPQNIELIVFSLSTNGHSITYQSYISGGIEINGLGTVLANNRREFRRQCTISQQLEEVEPS